MEILWKLVKLRKVYLAKSYGDGVEKIKALDGIDMEIARGEIFGVIGESGSGKTTLGKTIIRLIEPTGGKIYFKDTELTGLREKHLRAMRKDFRIVFQDPYRSLNPRMSIGNAISEGIVGTLRRKEQKDRVGELLSMVGIDPARSEYFPHQFSGGERQRIAVARALSAGPEFIVCDEPTSNLDLSIQAKILNLFMELKQSMGLTYMFISHNLKLIAFMADRTAVMYGGCIVETGITSHVLQTPVHPYTKILISSGISGVREGVTSAAESGDTNKGNGCAFYSKCPRSLPVCREQRPPLQGVQSGHHAACFVPD